MSEPQEIVKTIGGEGCDYSSIAAWEADLPRELDEIHTVEITQEDPE